MKRKSNYTTLIFATAVAILAALTVWDFKRARQREGLSENESKILSVSTDDIQAFVVKSKDETIELSRASGEWKMLQPIQDDGDRDAVAAFLSILTDAKVQSVGDDVKGPIAWAQYGLDPGVTIDLTGVAGKHETFQVSDKSAFDGSFYVRKGDQLLLGDRSWAHIADKQVSSLRSHMIWRAKGEVTRVQFQNGRLEKIADGWKLDPAFDLPVSAAKVNTWLGAVRELRAVEFSAEKPTHKELEKFFLSKPAMTAEFTVKKEGQETIVHWQIGQEKSEGHYIHTDSRNEIYKVNKFALRDILNPLTQFLDTASAVRFPIEQATEIELSNGGRILKFKKGAADWTADGSTAKADRIADIIQKIRNLDPVVGEPPAGLQFHPSDSLTIRAKDKILLEMQWTAEKDHTRWLKIGSLKQRFKIPPETLNALIQIDSKEPDGKN